MQVARIVVSLIALVGFQHAAGAQTSPASTPAPAAAANPAAPVMKAEELDALVAQIALYPDTLLANVLMASTYPLEVVEAARWVAANKSLKGNALSEAVAKQGWDDSVKALTATPSVLEMMNSKLDWTQKLGDAVLAQQPDVMDAVQRMRSRAQAQDKLKTTKEQKVSTKSESNKQVIVIEPAQPETVYVPYYDPRVVYGAWPYPAYPPYYYAWPPGYYAGAAIATGVAFGIGVAVGAWASRGWWGAGVGWGNNSININRNVNINNINARNNNWTHNPAHRQGVRYNNAAVSQKFSNNNIRGGAQNRADFRGRDGNQVLRPDNNRPGQGAGNRPGGDRPGQGAGNRPGGGNRPGAGGGGTQRPSGGNRPSGGGRDNAFSHVNDGGRAARAQADRGRASVGQHGGGGRQFSGGGGRGGGGGRMGGGGGRRR